MMTKFSLFKKPEIIPFPDKLLSEVKLPPKPVSTRWNAAVIYHATRIHLCEGFYKVERVAREGQLKGY